MLRHITTTLVCNVCLYLSVPRKIVCYVFLGLVNSVIRINPQNMQFLSFIPLVYPAFTFCITYNLKNILVVVTPTVMKDRFNGASVSPLVLDPLDSTVLGRMGEGSGNTAKTPTTQTTPTIHVPQQRQHCSRRLLGYLQQHQPNLHRHVRRRLQHHRT